VRQFTLCYDLKACSRKRAPFWEQLDSEVEPWRRGRVVLISIGSFYLVLQAAVLRANLLLGNLEALLASAASCAVFWIFFYLIWIGVNWIRWLAGAWLGLSGFAFLIWGLRDQNALALIFGSINLVFATYFCLSPSVYFFAKRQRENRSWLHSGMIVGALLLLSVTFFIGALGLFGYRAHAQTSAIEFAQDAAQRIYGEQDRDWLLQHSTAAALANCKERSVMNVFDEAISFMGRVGHLSAATGNARIFYYFPVSFRGEAHMIVDGVSVYGHARLYFFLVDSGQGWQLQSIWWEHPGTPMPEVEIVKPE